MNGIDVSEHQGDFDFTPYKDGFVIIRGGYGIRMIQIYGNLVCMGGRNRGKK